jgi:hypothetical protein
VLASGKVRCSPSSPCSRARAPCAWLWVALLLPIPSAARRGLGVARSGRESRLAVEQESRFGSRRVGRSIRTGKRFMRRSPGPRLTNWRATGSILMRQCPIRSGAFLDEAIRPLILIVALYTRVQTVFLLSSTLLSDGRRSPFSRPRPRWPFRRGGAGLYKAASSRSRVTTQTWLRTAANSSSAANPLSATKISGRYGISRTFLYSLWRRGTGPQSIHVGRKRLIPLQAAAEWECSVIDTNY